MTMSRRASLTAAVALLIASLAASTASAESKQASDTKERINRECGQQQQSCESGCYGSTSVGSDARSSCIRGCASQFESCYVERTQPRTGNHSSTIGASGKGKAARN